MSEEFDKEAWNNERIRLQSLVLESVNALSDFMGCNNFILPCGQVIWSIRHITE